MQRIMKYYFIKHISETNIFVRVPQKLETFLIPRSFILKRIDSMFHSLKIKLQEFVSFGTPYIPTLSIGLNLCTQLK